MNKRILVALGGNAILGKDASAKAQEAALRKTSQQLVKFVKNGDQLIIVHGNGPQVGNLLLQQVAGASPQNPAMPLDTCGAMTEGSIGYWLQNALNNELRKNDLPQIAATIITQVLVKHSDPAFKNPSKPIGPFYSLTQAQKIKQLHPDWQIVNDADRGYRRVVPSPRPLGIKEIKAIKAVVDSGNIVIAAGGGGVPVMDKNGALVGQEAVIDKDLAAAQLAGLLHADQLIILTAVDHVFLNFHRPGQKPLERVTVAQMKQYLKAKQFAPGSMLPKVQAAVSFVAHASNPDAEAVITGLNKVTAFINDGFGTIISK